MLDSREGLQEWVNENVESGKLFKRGKSKELDSMADFEIEAPYGLPHKGDTHTMGNYPSLIEPSL